MPSPIRASAPPPLMREHSLDSIIEELDLDEDIDQFDSPFVFPARPAEPQIKTLEEARSVIGGLTEEQIHRINVHLNSKRFFRLFKNELESALAHSKSFLKKLRSQERPSKKIPTIFTKAELEKTHKRRGDTALIGAIKSGFTEAAHALIAKMTSEQIGLCDRSGSNALVWTAYRQDTETAQLLIKHMTVEQINSTTVDGLPFVLWAIQHQHTALVRDLIEKKVKLDVKDSDGNTVFMSVCKHGLTSCAQLLIEQSKVDVINKHGDTALIWSVKNRHFEIVKLLLTKMTPEQIGFINNRGVSALLLAKSDQPILKLIREKTGFHWHLFLSINPSKMTLPKNEQVEAISEAHRNLIYANNGSLKKYILEHATYLSKAKMKQLSVVLTNVEDEVEITAVPKDPRERQKMYASMRRNLEHVAIKLADPNVSQETKKTALDVIIETHKLCITPQFQAASFARKLLTTGEVVAEPELIAENHIERILHQLRTDIFHDMFNENLKANYNIHNFNGMLAAVGKKVGVTDPDSAYDFDPADSSLKEKLLIQFYYRYNPSRIIHIIREAINKKVIPPSVVSELFAHYVFRNLKDDEYKTVETQIYTNPEEYDFTLTDAAVPYLLMSMGILDPQIPIESMKPNTPFFAKQIAAQKKSELPKKQIELEKLLRNPDIATYQLLRQEKNPLPTEALALLATVDTLNDEIKELQKWSDCPSAYIPKPIDTTRELTDEDIRLAAEEIKGMGLPISLEDLNFHRAVEKLVASNKWNKAQATELIEKIFFEG